MAENRNVIHVACCTDSNYLKYCTVMLTSLLENNKDLDIDIHVIAGSLNKDDRSVMKSVVEEKYGQRLHFYFPSEELLADCKIESGSYISIVTYYRIFLGSILPSDVTKVLYLDCDIIVNGSIKDLWNTDISDVSVGSIEDMWSGRAEIYSRLHYPSDYSYFNAGVLLINIDRFRLDGFEKRALDYLHDHIDELALYDQDLLNALLHDDKKFVAHRWNVQDGFLRRRRIERMPAESLKKLESELLHPVIIHYTGSKKPWHYKSQHPWKNLYFKYLDMTQWSGERPSVPVGYKIKLLSDSILRKCRIMKKKYLEFQKL